MCVCRPSILSEFCLLTVLILAVNDCQGSLLLSAELLSRGPIGSQVPFLALEQEALVPKKLPAWRRKEKETSVESSLRYTVTLNPAVGILLKSSSNFLNE